MRWGISISAALFSVAGAFASRNVTIDAPAPAAVISCRGVLDVHYSDLQPGDHLALLVVNSASGVSAGLAGPALPSGAPPDGEWSACLNFCYPDSFPNGQAVLTISVMSSDGQVQLSRSEAVVIDTFGPDMNFTISPNKQCFGKADDVIAIDGTMSDPNGLQLWQLIVDGRRVAAGSRTLGIATVHWSVKVSSLADGNHSARLVAYDQAGSDTNDGCSTGSNGGVRFLNFVVNRTAPVVNIGKPISSLSGTGTMNWTVSFDSSLTTLGLCYVELDGGMIGTLLPNVQSMDVDASQLADGVHTFRVNVPDLCGNVGYDEINFVVHNSVDGIPFGGSINLSQLAPTGAAAGYLTFTNPDTGELVNRAIVTVGADGQYDPVPVTSGIYDLTVQFDGWLHREVGGVDLTGDPVSMDFALTNGDANHDNMVGIEDISEVLTHFAETDDDADLNRNGHVDLYDLVIVFLNVGLAGD